MSRQPAAVAAVKRRPRPETRNELAYEKEVRLLAGLLNVAREAAGRVAARHHGCDCPIDPADGFAQDVHDNLPADAAGAAWALGQINPFDAIASGEIHVVDGRIGHYLRRLAVLADATDAAVASEGGGR